MTPQLMKSPLTGRFYIVTQFNADGSARRKHDCTGAVNAILDEVNAEVAELKTLLRSLYQCAVNDTRLDSTLEDAIRAVLGEKAPQEPGGEQK